MQYLFNVLFLSRWKPFDGTKGHKHPEYKRIKNLNKSIENQKELENHLKTYRTLENQKKLEKTNKTKKTSRKPKKTIKPKKTKKNTCQGVLLKHPNFLKSLEFLFFLVLLVFLVFSMFFCFFWFSRSFLCCGCKWIFAAPPLFLFVRNFLVGHVVFRKVKFFHEEVERSRFRIVSFFQ